MLAYYPRPSAGATGAKTAIASISDHYPGVPTNCHQTRLLALPVVEEEWTP